MALQTTWFVLVFVLLIGYAILDGLDFGVGVLYLTLKDERHRRAALQAIGPVWDGNEVWLLTGGGALFAAFPAVYATVFSGFYLALFLLLVALIARAVAIEFRSKVDSLRWRRVWDFVFSLGSTLAAVLLGVALGNIQCGVPVSEAGEYTGTFLGLLNTYALSVGVVSMSAFSSQGAILLAHKSQGAMHEICAGFARRCCLMFILVYLGCFVMAFVGSGSTRYSFFTLPHIGDAFGSPLPWVLAALVFVALAACMVAVMRNRFGIALIASSTAIGGMLALAGACLFPRLVPSSTDLAYSLTAFSSSSTQGTLTAMLIIALIGMPIVIAYTIYVHWVFRGKVTEGEGEY